MLQTERIGVLNESSHMFGRYTLENVLVEKPRPTPYVRKHIENVMLHLHA